MYEIIQLNDRTLDELTSAVNAAFSDYEVKIKITASQLKKKLEGVKANLDYSFGALYEGELIGFIINATEGNLAYDIMTGVLPEHRGKGVFTHMFETTLSFFNLYGIDTYQLEVIQSNVKARDTYLKNGFEKTASLLCFQGSCKAPNTLVQVKDYTPVDLQQFNHLWPYDPTFSNLFFDSTNHRCYVIGNESIEAFLVVSHSGGVRHFGYTNLNQLHVLLYTASQEYQSLVINNVDARDHETVSLLMSLDFDLYMKQYQMELKI